MEKLKINLEGKKEVLIEKGKTLRDILENIHVENKFPIVLGEMNGKVYELNSPIVEEGQLEFIDLGSDTGNRAYIRTLQFILIKATLEEFPGANISIQHSLSKGLYCEISKGKILTEKELEKIKARMKEIIYKDMPIKEEYFTKEETMEMLKKYNMNDRIKLLSNLQLDKIKLYELDGVYEYFYGPMGESTGIIREFDLMYYEPGFILRYPTKEEPDRLPVFLEHRKLANIFRETEIWGDILEVPNVGSLNEKVNSGEIIDIIRVSEALHEKKAANIADIIKDRENIRLILIAGPSSSGKTTFARRLAIQLRVNGLIPIPIGLDDYFVERDDTPKDENGEYDFESIHAVDLELFNEHLTRILKGEEVHIPKYNFITGKRDWNGTKVKLPLNGILIVEGIHGLNNLLTSSIADENKFKVYISALTQLNLDNHNRIATTDVRMIRRIVRDNMSRGYSAEETLKMWPSIRRGEEKNIFVFQENADIMFNSTLVYELCVLKKFALRELQKIEPTSPVYLEAYRLKSILNFFKEVDTSHIPENSILREFIGGSWFHDH
ncbi:nucleoside kinase [Clostridium tetani]|uniref:Uridine kinase n=1 Tax=Clostridium tetani (strain Massachusetts / E88) TaxID=212717 RepID=Q898U6_CLOTE|nr:nucleoside kinase [Clostridium tetani]AAO34983.1 uridine kinase [Clostridium tetani E88]KGI37369.1 ATPase AAA [Clostridium tetani ATCC 9441]KGI40775.1 ATPase AAA [Clostridium tetani]KGI42231.1 ATPase AAA [Clostridium tetani]KGI44463.1 ATPase AAA [Clostridium tetani]